MFCAATNYNSPYKLLKMQLDCGHLFWWIFDLPCVLTNINHMLNHRRPVNELLDYYSQLQLVEWLNPPPCRLEIPF